MIDHISIPVKDFDKMSAYFAEVLGTLGYRKGIEYSGGLQLIDEADGDNTWISAAEEGIEPAPLHLAWRAKNIDQVKAFYEAALAGGGTDNGAPGPRDYHPGYYACFVHDPEGNNTEAVLHDYEG